MFLKQNSWKPTTTTKHKMACLGYIQQSTLLPQQQSFFSFSSWLENTLIAQSIIYWTACPMHCVFSTVWGRPMLSVVMCNILCGCNPIAAYCLLCGGWRWPLWEWFLISETTEQPLKVASARVRQCWTICELEPKLFCIHFPISDWADPTWLLDFWRTD